MPAAGIEITRSSLRDQVLAVLRQRLVSGELQPGEIYSAQAVAAELGVSGSPVREAMLTLVNQGLMAPVRNRGFMVVAMSDKDRGDVFEMRLWLEVPAMEKLALNNDGLCRQSGHFRALAEDIIHAAQDGDVVTFLDSDRQFHVGLTDLLENERLTATVSELRDRTRLYGLERLKKQGTLVDSAEEHVHILDALVAGDVDKVRQLMTSHIGHVLGKWAGNQRLA